MWQRSIWWLCLSLLPAGLLAVGGCREDVETPVVDHEPDMPEHAEPRPAPRPVISDRPRQQRTVLRINERPVAFPGPRLVIQERRPELTIVLFSDEPEAEADPADRYYLQIRTDTDDPALFDGAQWHFRAPGLERVDSPYGIMLASGRQLQPFDITVSLRGDEEGWLDVRLVGQFLMFQEGSDMGQLVRVEGHLAGPLEEPEGLLP